MNVTRVAEKLSEAILKEDTGLLLSTIAECPNKDIAIKVARKALENRDVLALVSLFSTRDASESIELIVEPDSPDWQELSKSFWGTCDFSGWMCFVKRYRVERAQGQTFIDVAVELSPYFENAKLVSSREECILANNFIESFSEGS